MSDVEAGMAWSAIARSAHRAYIFAMGVSDTFHDWEEMSPGARAAWEAAARQVGSCLELRGEAKPPNEERWIGWQPPK